MARTVDAAGPRRQGDTGAQALASSRVGQGVGLMSKAKTCHETVLDFAMDYVEAVERIAASASD